MEYSPPTLQATGLRLLQKGHATSDLADVAVSGNADACLMAAVSAEGDLFIWELSLEDNTNVVAKEVLRDLWVAADLEAQL